MTANGATEKLYSPTNQFINASNRKGADTSVKQNNGIFSSLLTLDLADDLFWNYKHISLFNGGNNNISMNFLNTSRTSMNGNQRNNSKANQNMQNTEL